MGCRQAPGGRWYLGLWGKEQVKAKGGTSSLLCGYWETWEELEIGENYFNKRQFPAIGEIGIDLYWDKSTLDIQMKAFEKQIFWAIERDLPIVIHTI